MLIFIWFILGFIGNLVFVFAYNDFRYISLYDFVMSIILSAMGLFSFMGGLLMLCFSLIDYLRYIISNLGCQDWKSIYIIDLRKGKVK